MVSLKGYLESNENPNNMVETNGKMVSMNRLLMESVVVLKGELKNLDEPAVRMVTLEHEVARISSLEHEAGLVGPLRDEVTALEEKVTMF